MYNHAFAISIIVATMFIIVATRINIVFAKIDAVAFYIVLNSQI